jgi:hypothetical protein
MTYRGRVKNGQILLDDPVVLPEGTEVRIEVAQQPAGNGDELAAMLMRHAGNGRDLPTDLAAQHDHYAHGKPKR